MLVISYAPIFIVYQHLDGKGAVSIKTSDERQVAEIFTTVRLYRNRAESHRCEIRLDVVGQPLGL